MPNTPPASRRLAADHPPVAGMSVEVWSWLRETMEVRPHVVARIRAALDAGHQATPDQVAAAMLRHQPYRGAA
jgi:hypothetical protein